MGREVVEQIKHGLFSQYCWLIMFGPHINKTVKPKEGRQSNIGVVGKKGYQTNPQMAGCYLLLF